MSGEAIRFEEVEEDVVVVVAKGDDDDESWRCIVDEEYDRRDRFVDE